jgi:hypothetical protein
VSKATSNPEEEEGGVPIGRGKREQSAGGHGRRQRRAVATAIKEESRVLEKYWNIEHGDEMDRGGV